MWPQAAPAVDSLTFLRAAFPSLGCDGAITCGVVAVFSAVAACDACDATENAPVCACCTSSDEVAVVEEEADAMNLGILLFDFFPIGEAGPWTEAARLGCDVHVHARPENLGSAAVALVAAARCALSPRAPSRAPHPSRPHASVEEN